VKSEKALPELTVVIPCLDEADNVRRYEAELLPHLPPGAEVVLVDDGSAEPLSAPAGMRVVRHERNRGVGAALRTGFAEAKGDWLVTLDADLTFSPSLIPALLRKRDEEDADMVAGSPWLGGLPGVPLRRRLPSALLNAFYRGFLSASLTSYTSIFRLYRAAALKTFDLRADGFEINAEIAARFVRARLKTAEIAAPLTVRRHGTSRLETWRELRNHAALVGRLVWSR